MTTPEQQAREMLETATSSDLPVIVADIIAERDALKAEFKIIDEMNDQLREQNTAVDEACAKLEKENDALKAELAAIKGAGEPVTELHDLRIKELIKQHFVTGENQWDGSRKDYLFRSFETPRNVYGADLVAFARDVEAHIKGAK